MTGVCVGRLNQGPRAGEGSEIGQPGVEMVAKDCRRSPCR